MFHLIEPRLGRISGGLRYNHAVLDAANGRITRHELAGTWPDPSDEHIDQLDQLIARLDGPVLLDGLIGCALENPLDAHVPIVQLVHALATNPEAKRRQEICLQAADAVVATSRYAADKLQQRSGVEAVVATPGVQARPLATGSNGTHFVNVGGLEPNKNQRFLAAVLTQLHTMGVSGWHCTFAGPTTDAGYAEELRQDLAQLPVSSTTIAGELDTEALDALYDSADLLLLPSQAETFGLVVREATAAGLPALVTAGTGAEEALGGGAALELDHTIWVEALQRWLTDTAYRTRLQGDAKVARQQLTYGWRATADTILEVLESACLG